MVDIITMEIIQSSLEYIAEEMGIVLRNSAYSPNIKERMDHSCAIFDAKGQMLAHAEHIPVHLGAMPMAVRETIKMVETINEGDMILVNDPYMGGTHLPDLTLIAPIYYGHKLAGFVANRAHHSDIGGKTPGSMPGNAMELYEEGLIIPPTKLVRMGEINKEILNLIIANSRTPKIRRGDILAQVAANIRGIERVKKIVEKYGLPVFMEATEEILSYSEKLARSEISKMPRTTCEATDYLDDGGERWNKPIKIHVKIEIQDKDIIFDFRNSDDQIPSPLNATRAVTISATYFAFKCIIDQNIPSNDGTYRPLKILTRKGSILDAQKPYPVSGGNVETSQRIVDVIFKALSKIIPEIIPAASQGTMNNISFGGIDPRTGKTFSFYETIGGGSGARPGMDGVDGVHSNMTNTMNTPIEEIERQYPIMILEYSLRQDSCGAGKWRGGLGIIRKYKALAPIRVSLMGERHKYAPWGLEGGLPGALGEYVVVKDNNYIKISSKTTIELQPGDILIIKTPGGGGYGHPKDRAKEPILCDLEDQKISRDYAERYYVVKAT